MTGFLESIRLRIFWIVWQGLLTAFYLYLLVVFILPMAIRGWSISPAIGILLLFGTVMFALLSAVHAYAVVRVARGRAPTELDAAPISNTRVDPVRIKIAMADLDSLEASWWPRLRERVQRFIDVSDEPGKWALRAQLLRELYDLADRGAMPFAERRKINDLRRAINVDIDAP